MIQNVTRNNHKISSPNQFKVDNKRIDKKKKADGKWQKQKSNKLLGDIKQQ